MDKHVTAVAILMIAFGALELLTGVLIFAGMAGIGMFTGSEEAAAILSGIGLIIGFFCSLTSVPSIIAGIGLLYRQSWARILALIVSFIELINFPFVTIIAVYAIVILLKDETARLFQSRPATA